MVKRPTDRKDHRALHGLTRTLIYNMVVGVTEGYEKRLEIQGVGYRAQLKGKTLELALGYSHPVKVEAPEGIEFEVPMPTQVVVRGIDKQAVGEVAAQDPQGAPAGALQGQGRALRRRARRAEGRQARVGQREDDDDSDDREGKAQARRRTRRCGARCIGTAERPRLSVYRSNRGVFAQLVDDERGHTLAAGELDRAGPAPLKPMERATKAGELIAERARAAGLETCVFDRGGYRYHGRVKALADGARSGGLKF